MVHKYCYFNDFVVCGIEFMSSTHIYTCLNLNPIIPITQITCEF